MPLPRALIPILLLSVASVSCVNLSENARASAEQRPAATDPVAGSAQLAVGFARTTALAAVRQPVTTAVLGVAVLWHRPREVVNANLPISPDLTLPAEIPGSREFEALLDEHDMPKPELGKLKWLVDGPEFFPELDRRMKEARQSIDMQVFIFDNDDIAVRYAEKLKSHAQRVRTRVLFDDLGSTFAHISPPETPAPPGFVPPVDMFRFIKADSEVRVRRSLNPWLVCDHSKLIIFDRKSAILGGMNIGREYYSEWHDLMVGVEGPIVASLSRDFNRSWRKAGPYGDFALLGSPSKIRKPPAMPGSFPIRILRTDPAEFRYEILKSTMLAIRAARERVLIQTPYFAHNDVVSALEAAAHRGVDVRIIIPKEGDSTIMDAANLVSSRILINAGAKVYRYSRMTHMKVLVCDNWASVGSANLDTLSMRINRELNIAFNDPAEVRELIRRVFAPDFRVSTRLTLKETELPLAPVIGLIADQL